MNRSSMEGSKCVVQVSHGAEVSGGLSKRAAAAAHLAGMKEAAYGPAMPATGSATVAASSRFMVSRLLWLGGSSGDPQLSGRRQLSSPLLPSAAAPSARAATERRWWRPAGRAACGAKQRLEAQVCMAARARAS